MRKGQESENLTLLTHHKTEDLKFDLQWPLEQYQEPAYHSSPEAAAFHRLSSGGLWPCAAPAAPKAIGEIAQLDEGADGQIPCVNCRLQGVHFFSFIPRFASLFSSEKDTTCPGYLVWVEFVIQTKFVQESQDINCQ
jgi:hypothetical protein